MKRILPYSYLSLLLLAPALYVGINISEGHEPCKVTREHCECEQTFAERLIREEMECRKKLALGKYTYSKKTILKLCKTPDVRIMPIQRDAGCACK